VQRIPIPLGGASKDYDSRQSREEAINCYIETDGGNFRSLKRVPLFKDFITLGSGPIRGMHVAAGVLYVVSGPTLYRVVVTPVGSVQKTAKGTVTGFTGPVTISSIGTDTPEVMV